MQKTRIQMLRDCKIVRNHNTVHNQTNQSKKNVGKGISMLTVSLPELTSGAANPIVLFKHTNRAVSFVPKAGKGVSGVPSAEYVAVLL